ncbi:hypothetical protein N7532_001342 [Penicillium argentinense]|uniref:Glycerate dehydrogenase n=1 Tax=Penicillium argentinense TaxID=1131581 RepID=A0A9W9KME4_9EURO|nr:uncharacterized protein N7532_001342 [Penicillium argentinense]KAJ5110807.1 hypothetical protein N7532_001342 [Penicillium argentinense]
MVPETPHIVCLEECHCPVPPLPFPHTYKGYNKTSHDQVPSRLGEADIAITTIVPITCADLDAHPRLKCVFVWATGVDWVDIDGFRARGVTVIRAPQSNVDTVSEHAIAFYFASRRRIVDMHNRCMASDEYAEKRTLTYHFGGPPLTCSAEVVMIIGHGFLGKRVQALVSALGMKVLIAERKGMSGSDVREGRTEFNEALRKATVVILTTAKNPETIGLIGASEFETMRKDSILINVSRGGIVDEGALVDALRNGEIGAAATDVFEKEPPVRGESVLLSGDVPNLIVSPHLAWFSVQTIQNLQDLLLRGLVAYYNDAPINTV